MKNTRKSIALFLTAAIASGLLASCGGTSGSTDTTTDASVTPPDSTTVDQSKQLGFDKEDNGGTKFNILTTVHAAYEYIVEEQTGEVVNDAVYNRNADVEDLLGIDFEFIVEAGHWAVKDTFNALVTNSVMADDGAYDLVNGVTVCVIPTAADGLFLDATELEYVDFSKPWWVHGMTDNLAIGGKLFGFIGDASLSLYKDLTVAYFNKTLLETYDLENPYDLVRSGEWTIDKMIEMATGVSKNIDGEGTMDIKTDQFGYIAHYVPQRAFQTATEMKIIDFNDEGNPFVTNISERDIDIYTKLDQFLMNRDLIYAVDSFDHSSFVSTFNEGRALFMIEFLYGTEYLRDMKDDFGIIPLPKADENQEDYHTQIGTSTSMFFVPKTTNDPVLTSKVCEALSFYSWENVVPTYYELALKEKYTRDEDVKDMLELIRNSAQMDFTFAYSTSFSPFPNCITECRENNSIGGNLSSYMATNSTLWQATIEEILDAYAGLE